MFYLNHINRLGVSGLPYTCIQLRASCFDMATKPKKNEPADYEAALQELEQLLAHIESGALPLDQLLAGYQRGAELLAFCRNRLQSVQEQIQVLDQHMSQPVPE